MRAAAILEGFGFLPIHQITIFDTVMAVVLDAVKICDNKNKTNTKKCEYPVLI